MYLNPCPFCGNLGKNLRTGALLESDCRGVSCDSCGGLGPIALTIQKAIHLWNLRAAPSGQHCPRCWSQDLILERRPGGYAKCKECEYSFNDVERGVKNEGP